MATITERPEERTPPPVRPRGRRRPTAAGRAMLTGLICFGLWSLVDAQALKAAADAGPLGLRRTASLVVLTPLAAVNRVLGLNHLESAIDNWLGRNVSGPPGGTDVGLPPIVHVSPTPTPSVTVTPTLPPGEFTTLRRATRTDPLRVLVAGDSVGEDLGIGLERKLSGNPRVDVFSAARQSTGLARPDYFNWPAALKLDIGRFHPDVVVCMFGANDNQSFIVEGHVFRFGTREWSLAYQSRIATMMSIAQQSGAHVVWVGQPIMGSASRTNDMRRLNYFAKAQIKLHPDVLYVDSWHLFVDASGAYSAYLANSKGQQVLVRAQDGVHLTVAGDDRLAYFVVAQMRLVIGFPRT